MFKINFVNCQILMELLLVIILTQLNLNKIEGITCKNDKNSDVDWFVLYKIPKIEESESDLLKSGYGFVYLDSMDVEWKYSGKSIKDNDNPLAYTMNQLYSNAPQKNFMYMSYNDESPDGKEHGTKGHTKGVLMSNKTNGIWLVHSLPRFPIEVKQMKDNGGYFYPPNGAWNGQTFLCLTFGIDQLLNISQVIFYDTPNIHDKNIPESFWEKNEYLSWLDKGGDITKHMQLPWVKITTITTLWNKTPFVAFGKYKKFNADIYAELIAQYYNTDLLSETWQQDSKHALNSSCQIHPTVENIKGIAFKGNLMRDPSSLALIGNNTNLLKNSKGSPIGSSSIKFSELIDHSKWAISNDDVVRTKKFKDTKGKSIVCIGDLNRELHQEVRSGGMVCTTNVKLWKAFKDIVDDIEACPRSRDFDDNKISNQII